MMMSLSNLTFVRRIGVAVCFFLSSAVFAQQVPGAINVVQACGIDQRVDYVALTKIGPWDDRNYKLTAEDLKYLAPDEEQLQIPIPAFFRVELRKEMPHLRRSGPAQYPRSAVPLFNNRHGELVRAVRAASDCRDVEADRPAPKKKCSH